MEAAGLRSFSSIRNGSVPVRKLTFHENFFKKKGTGGQSMKLVSPIRNCCVSISGLDLYVAEVCCFVERHGNRLCCISLLGDSDSVRVV